MILYLLELAKVWASVDLSLPDRKSFASNKGLFIIQALTRLSQGDTTKKRVLSSSRQKKVDGYKKYYEV